SGHRQLCADRRDVRHRPAGHDRLCAVRRPPAHADAAHPPRPALLLLRVVRRRRHRGGGHPPAAPLGPRLEIAALGFPMSTAAILMLVCFFAWLAIGMPIAFSMLASAFLYLLLNHQDIGLVASQSLNGLFKSFVLLAVPLFIVAADIMNAGTISERLLQFSTLCVGRVRGGLAHVTVIASMIFSGMSGSAIAPAAGPRPP